MGCINSKKDLNDINSNRFLVSNINNEDTVLWVGQLEISRTELTLYRKGKKPTQWPLQCLRRYGCDADIFSFEAGRRCDTGPGIYAFRCRRAEALFDMLKNYIQVRAYSTDENINSSDMTFSTPANTNIPTTTHRNSVCQNQQNSISRANNECIQNLNHRTASGGLTTSQSLSPNGTIHSTSNQSRSSDTITPDANYLEPNPLNRPPTRFNLGLRLGSVSSGPLSPDLQSPGSPNSITNILEVTPLNSLPFNNANQGVSNLYQEFPLNVNTNVNTSSNISSKKLSLDIPPQEQAPARNVIDEKKGNNSVTISNVVCESPLKCISSNNQIQIIPMSPNGYDSAHSYMNISLGDIGKPKNSLDSPNLISAQTPTTSKLFGFIGQNMYNGELSRCYENLEPGDMRPLLLKNQRYSKPDIFTNIELPLNNDKSEPCTPTIHNNSYDSTVNYIILDLNEVNLSSNLKNLGSNNCINNNNIGIMRTSSENGTNNIFSNNCISIGSKGQNSLLPPESPKKASLGYATIDFNKTAALSSSTTPSTDLDSEGSRKTRHSSTILPSRHSNSVSSD